MAKSQKTPVSAKVQATQKNHGTKGNFPAKKDWVTLNGGTKKQVVLCSGNFEPARTGDKIKDAENLRAYRDGVRADLRTLAKQRAPKPSSFFDLYQLLGGKAKHPAQLAQHVLQAIGYNASLHKELRII
jgi:hypothetical protein